MQSNAMFFFIACYFFRQLILRTAYTALYGAYTDIKLIRNLLICITAVIVHHQHFGVFLRKLAYKPVYDGICLPVVNILSGHDIPVFIGISS